MVKVYIPDNKNNMWVIDANGCRIHAKCIDDEHCRYLYKVLNEVENNGYMVNDNNNSAGSRARDNS